MILLALGDLRTEVQLLSDQFTVTGLGYAIRHHQLAVVVLLGSPSLWRRFG
ncbi:putative conserved membrane protein [Synechococcus sp. PROS-U-1]|nr:putative conserved membrane protein [Synechococcus sp. PROS-U-1]